MPRPTVLPEQSAQPAALSTQSQAFSGRERRAVPCDSGPQPMSCASLGACSASPPRQGSGFVALPITDYSLQPYPARKNNQSTWELHSPSYIPAYNGTQGETPASGSPHLQSQASGPIWPGSLMGNSTSCGLYPLIFNDYRYHSMVLPEQVRKFAVPPNCQV